MYSKELSESTQYYELIVIGLGLVGSSTLYEAAKLLNDNSHSGLTHFSKKPTVLGIEQYEISHNWGSSHGESRITRQAIGEGIDYVTLAKKSQRKLKEIQIKTNGKFGTVCYEENTGVLIIGPRVANSLLHDTKGFLQATQTIAFQHQIPHDNYDSKEELAKHFKQFKQFKFKNHEGGYHEKTMGIMDPEAYLKAQIYLAKQENAIVHTNEKVLNFNKIDNGKIKVKTSKAEYHTNKLIITAGPWISDFLTPLYQENLKVYRQTVFYFEIEQGFQEQFMLGHFPPFIWDLGINQCVYGFPIMQKGTLALKIGTESFEHSTLPGLVDRTVSEEEKQHMYEHFIKPNLNGVLPICKEAFVCLYTKTPNSQFLVDYIPGFDNKVMFASTCSGHGAKHSPAVGENLAQQMILGYSDDNILKFSFQGSYDTLTNNI